MIENKLHIQILPENQRKIFDHLIKNEWLKDFYLAGGTALALYIGHRQSVDFDFFTEKDFDTKKIILLLKELGEFELSHEEKNTLVGYINEVSISFFTYKYDLIDKPTRYNSLIIAGKSDIALMKLEAISGRGNKKDFIDLYFLLREYSFDELFKNYKVKYGRSLSNQYHLLKSLVYFADAEDQAMPRMIEKVKWETVKKEITGRVKSLRLFE